MKFKDAKKLIGTECTLLEMDNFFSPFDNNSLFNGDEGRDAIEELIREKKSNFSYVCDCSEDDGYCVEFELITEDADSISVYGRYANTIVRITDVWEH